jgi:hypothetical protein
MEKNYSKYAKTDIIDEKGQFLIRYDLSFVIEFIALGIVAFLLLGYFGYSDDPPLAGMVFHEPWPLLLWLFLLYLTIHLTILRYETMRGRLIAVLSVDLLSIALVIGAWYSGLVRWLVLDTSLTRALLSPPFVPLMVIVGMLLVVFVLSLRLVWLRSMLWMLTILLGVGGLLLGAQFSAIYIHTFAGHSPASDPRLAFGHVLVLFLVAATGIVGGFIAGIAGCALMLLNARVLTNATRFLVYLLVFGYFTVPAVAVINTIVWLTGISFRTPFFQPSVSGLIAVAIFIVTGSKWVLSVFIEPKREQSEAQSPA